MIKLDVYNNGWCRMDVEDQNNSAFVHLYIEDWSLSKRKQLPNLVADLETAIRALGYSQCFITAFKHDKTLRKFLLMIGCEPYIDISDAQPQAEIWRRKV